MKNNVLQRICLMVAVFLFPALSRSGDFFSNLEVQPYGGIGIPSGGAFYQNYGIAGTWGFSAGYRVSDRFSILLDECHSSFPMGHISTALPADVSWADLGIQELAVLAQFRFPISNSILRPYIFLGTGLANIGVSEVIKNYGLYTPTNQECLLLEAGGGVECPLDDQLSVFVQEKGCAVYDQSTFLDADSPTLYVPLTAGVHFQFGAGDKDKITPSSGGLIR